ncbi:acyltransferase family protein [Lichenibacterium ramalinae]|uniref:acyltransferase family protein n=1 Tax=Lichenibacterium ramalinae TaxID=2316527 RepID=UPI0013EC8C7F|nr:acyltransferase family protein [Lichenibacterium ramalinae]
MAPHRPTEGRGGAYRPDIDGLRAVAVTVVVLFHYGFAALPGGFVGVDVFFVISGFLITAITRDEIARGRFSLAAFYERRIRRIVPALVAVLLACGLASLFVFLPEDLRLLAKSTMAAAVFGSNLLFSRLAADYFDADNLTLQPLLHTWSLAVEGQFYLLFPLVLLALKRRPRAAAAVLAGLAALSFAWGTWGAIHRPVPAFYLLPGRAWELLLGGLLACRPPPPLRGLASDAAVAAGLGAIALSALVYDAATPFPGPPALVPCLGALLVIGGGGGRVSALLGAAAPAWLGRISYSLYLWHWPVIVLARYVRGPDLPLATRVALLAATVALAGLSYAAVERPFIARRTLPSRRGLLAGFALATAASLGLGQVLDLTGRGLLPLTQLPAAVATLADGHFDRLEGECPVPAGGDALPYPCRFGSAAARPTVLLWGNSYARMWVPALAQDAEAHGAAGLAAIMSKCPPLLGLEIPALPGCAPFNAAAAAFVAAHPTIRTVVLGADWFLYDADLGRLDATLAALGAAGVRSFVLLAPPQSDYPVPRRLAMAALRGEPSPPPPSEAHARAAQRVSTELIAAVAARHGATLIDPMTRLCDGLTCPVERDGHPLFYDAGHLTVFAARAIHGLFDPLFGP